MRTRRSEPGPIPIATICADLASYINRQEPDVETLVRILAAGMIAARESSDPAGPALAALFAAVGDYTAEIFTQIAERIELVALDTAGSA